MKITIIGAGHIGSAIATCLAQGYIFNEKDNTADRAIPHLVPIGKLCHSCYPTRNSSKVHTQRNLQHRRRTGHIGEFTPTARGLFRGTDRRATTHFPPDAKRLFLTHRGLHQRAGLHFR